MAKKIQINLLIMILIMISAVCINNKAYSQMPVNKSIVDTTKQWNNFYSTYNGGAYTSIVTIGEDTIVGDKEYRKVYSTLRDSTIKNCNFLIREEANIVYLHLLEADYLPIERREIIVYNFNLVEGDEFDVPLIRHGYGTGTDYAYVVAVDTIEINETQLKRIRFLGDYDWIEGIGSTEGLLEGGFLCGASSYLLCAKQEEDLIFTADYSSHALPSTCFIEPYGLSDISVNQIQIYPHLATNYINIVPESQERLNVKITDIYGRAILDNSICGATQLNISNLAKGAYNCIVCNTKGSVVSTQKIIKL